MAKVMAKVVWQITLVILNFLYNAVIKNGVKAPV
jgi:hypothetical protein